MVIDFSQSWLSTYYTSIGKKKTMDQQTEL